MGMYDYVHVAEEINLPGYPPTVDRNNFQTKDFSDPFFTVYKITKEGKLLAEMWHYDEVPEEERPCYPFKNDWEQIIGMVKKVTDSWEEFPFHGWLTFYTEVNKEWYEYCAKFTDGSLIEVKRIESETTTN